LPLVLLNDTVRNQVALLSPDAAFLASSRKQSEVVTVR
jgi:hypothetical protein